MSYAGQVVVITGASRGIGRALALAFAKEGAKLGLLARNQQNLESLKLEATQAGAAAVEIASVSIVDREAVLAAMDGLKATLGEVDVMIANAGVSISVSAQAWSTQDAKQVLDTNIMGVIYAIESVMDDMRARRSGHIVGISSLASYIPVKGHGVYSASKTAVSFLLSALRQELKQAGVAVTTICPGYVRTDMTAKNEYPMPFLMDLAPATDLMMNAIRRKRRVFDFPWQTRLFLRFYNCLPVFLREWLGERFMH